MYSEITLLFVIGGLGNILYIEVTTHVGESNRIRTVPEYGHY